ncbi:3',5'-cyclic AMP phosphodiesterase CpdA [Pseudomonas syringae pv. actinidiae]|uniref:3',5'-cyclic AMP phosphodiesterase CpdA n=1 Tax=Pseudomonas syringae pv. actinidiae TaxID=103796 RepID=A0A2V0QKF3_PSESF|nr:3',5'-cyclic AMP phosphodiesterase CpdA [Pseudomonas syringae pv. actinidiae]
MPSRLRLKRDWLADASMPKYLRKSRQLRPLNDVRDNKNNAKYYLSI